MFKYLIHNAIYYFGNFDIYFKMTLLKKTSIVEELERNVSFTVQHSLHVHVPPLNSRNTDVICVKVMIHCC